MQRLLVFTTCTSFFFTTCTSFFFTTAYHCRNSMQRLLVFATCTSFFHNCISLPKLNAEVVSIRNMHIIFFTTAYHCRNSMQRLLVFATCTSFFHNMHIIFLHNCISLPKLNAEVVSIRNMHIISLFTTAYHHRNSMQRLLAFTTTINVCMCLQPPRSKLHAEVVVVSAS